LRPSSDKLRETLFNILGKQVRDTCVLDAFAGTGALGIEAISRGAETAVFIERDKRATRLIENNLERCGIKEQCRIVRGVLPNAMDEVNLPSRFEIVFLDPPYDHQSIDAILSVIGGRLANHGVLVLESARRSKPSMALGLAHVRRVVSGQSAIDFYQCKKELSQATAR
jgi:16S rRNA (guanine966-N2)-methyltransferase